MGHLIMMGKKKNSSHRLSQSLLDNIGSSKAFLHIVISFVGVNSYLGHLN